MKAYSASDSNTIFDFKGVRVGSHLPSCALSHLIILLTILTIYSNDNVLAKHPIC